MAFPLALALHDLEEALLAERWSPCAPGRLRRRLPWLPEPMAQATRVTTRHMAITFVVEKLACLAAIRPALRSHDTDLRPYPVAVAGFAFTSLAT